MPPRRAISKGKERNQLAFLRSRMAELKELKRANRRQETGAIAPDSQTDPRAVGSGLEAPQPAEPAIQTGGDGFLCNNDGHGGDYEPDEFEEPTPSLPDDPPPSSRDLANLDLFDWEWAAPFGTSPGVIKALTPVEKASMLCLNLPGVTRRIWDCGIKPLVEAVSSQTLEEGREVSVGSHKVVIRELEECSGGVAPVLVDACRKHCCVFNETRRIEDRCPHCNQKRLNEDGAPFLQTAIFPLKNMLRAILCHQDRAKKCMEYRSKFLPVPADGDDSRKDFWDGDEPRRMMKPGGLLGNPAVLALTVTGDAAEYASNPKKSIMPYIALLQNLPPDLRYRYEVPLAIHAGEAKDDSVWRAIFKVAEYQLPRNEDKSCPLGLWYGEFEFSYAFCLATGDYPMAAAELGLVSHTGRASCRICTAAGYKMERGYYLVNEPPTDDPRTVKEIDATFPFENIPCGHSTSALRTREGYLDTIQRRIEPGLIGKQKDLIRLETGVSVDAVPALVQALPQSVPFHRLLPVDPMHAVPLNICKHLLQFITNFAGQYKGMPFCLSEDMEKGFISDLKASTVDIPEELMKRPLLDFRKCSARSEHFLAICRLAPILLRNRLDAPYVVTFSMLATIMDYMAAVRSSDSHIEELESGILQFQKAFYKFWYARKFNRARICRTYFHALGHIPDAIRAWGPPFVFAQWAMERFNGKVIERARLNAATPVQTSANKIGIQFRIDQLLPREATAKPSRPGLQNKLPQKHWLLDSREKEAIGRYFKTTASSIGVEEVTRYESFSFKTPDGTDHRAVAIDCNRKTFVRRRHYVWCDRLDTFVRILSLFDFAGKELAFAQTLPRSRMTLDVIGNNRCRISEWSTRLSVIECEDFTQLVAFVTNSLIPSELFLLQSLRVYTGEKYVGATNDEDIEDDG